MIQECWWGNVKEELGGDGRMTPKWIVTRMEWRAVDSTDSG